MMKSSRCWLKNLEQGLVWVWTFDRWLLRQVYAYSVTCLFISCHMNFEVIKRFVVLAPGSDSM